MAAEWYYQDRGIQVGPVDSGELRRLAETGIVRPEMLVRHGDSGRWVRAEQVRSLFQRSTPAPSLRATPPKPPPLPPPVASLSSRSGESPIRHGLGAAAVNEASEKLKRVSPVIWATITAGSGTALLLLLWALVFRGGSTPKQEADKDQPPLAAAQSAESGSSAPAPQPLAPHSSERPTHFELADRRGSSDAKQHRPDALSPTQPPRVPHTPEQRVRPKPPPQVARAPTPQPAPQPEPPPKGFFVDGKNYMFPATVSDESAIRWLNKNVTAKTRGKTPLPLDKAGGRSQFIDPDEHAKQRQSTPLSAQGIAEYAEEMGLKPEQVSPEVLAEYIELRKAEAERAAKDPNVDMVRLRDYKDDTATMERDLDRPWSNQMQMDHFAGKPERMSPAKAPPAAGVPSPPGAVLDLADLAELVGPSVVQVNVTGPEEVATGSGFVLDKQGTIVTNYHVIEDATAGRVVFSDRTSAPIGGYLGVWPEKDIALVRVECPPEKLHPLPLATSAPRQGERVAAFGSPLGLQQSVSEGIVSAVRESKELQALGPIDVNARLIQTTTPISHGNSGGPLVDMKGMVVGVNTLTFRPLGGENLNFAVAAVELPPLLLAKNETPSPLPASDPAADGVRRIVSRAQAHVRAGDHDRAIPDFTEAIRLDPKNADAYWGRGFAYFCKHHYDSAIADITEAIRLDPKYRAARYTWRGDAYRRKRDDDSAIADYTEAIRVDPAYAMAYSCRGSAYLSKKDYDSAIADFTQVIRLVPKDADAYRSRGDAYHGKRDFDSAIADLTDAIRLDPKDWSAYCGRGRAYYSKRDYDAAIADFIDAIRLDPKDADAYWFRGMVYDSKGDYDAAIADYTQAIRLDPKDASAFYWRGMAYQAKGQRAAAERDFAQAKRLGYKP
ncbi:MAG: tetratricopeptide repeat protein [Rhodopirellula sp.]|nr:tetratricopeptide repeat protein [Rhodopirellula sp.]